MQSVAESAQTVQFDTLTFPEAVQRVSELAHARLSAPLHGRLERGTALVLHGGVFFEDDGRTCQVLASDGQRWYHTNGRCDCEDYARAPERLCKHRVAWMVYRRASELQREWQPSAPTAALTSEQPQAATGMSVASLPEAPASVNCHITLAGRQVQVTLRDTDEARLLARLEALLSRYPVEAPAAVTPSTPRDAESWCLLHGVEMTRQSNQRGAWWSHKLPEGGWCKGKGQR